jgi:hypothetical protein
MIRKPLGCLFKIIFALLLLIVAVGVVSVLLVEHFAVDVAAKILNQKTGFSLSGGKQEISILSGSGDVQDVIVANPDRFDAKDFLHFDELKVVVEPTSLLGKRPVIDELLIDVDSFAMVRNKDGSLNLTALADGLTGGTAGASAPSGGPKTPIPPFTIKSFTLRIKSAKFYDFQHSDGKPEVVTLNYERTFTDINESNYAQVAVAIGADLSTKGYAFLANALKDELLDPATYLDAAKSVGGMVINGVGSAAKGAGSALRSIIP